MDTVKILNKGKAQIIAHRGVSKLEKENTMAAFIAAGNRSYFGIETDIHVTVDGKFIVIHDDTTGRVAEIDISVENSYYEDLRNLRLKDLDNESYRCDLVMPNLSEYINCCKKYEKKAVLEIKNPMTENQVLNIINEIKGLDYLHNVIFISFSYDNLVYIKKHYPDQKVQFLTWETEGLIEKLLAHKMDLDIYYKCVTPELVEECHKNGIEVNCWTVDELEDTERLIEYGVDYITSNILE